MPSAGIIAVAQPGTQHKSYPASRGASWPLRKPPSQEGWRAPELDTKHKKKVGPRWQRKTDRLLEGESTTRHLRKESFEMGKLTVNMGDISAVA